MQIVLNGENTMLDSNVTVLDLVKKYDLSPQKVAVELNLEIISRDEYEDYNLSEGDRVEIVEFVGGG